MEDNVNYEEIKSSMMEIQDELCKFLVNKTGQQYLEDLWSYEKGEGGGRTRVWEEADGVIDVLEKGGVNFSAIAGNELPSAALANIPASLTKSEFRTTGVSVVIHPHSPLVPTIHMNIRYFEAGDLKNNNVQVWWFGGGIDLTPTYPKFTQIIDFHKTLESICLKHNQNYDKFKKICDEYFYLAHRKENRGVGGIFFDHLRSEGDMSKRKLWNFVKDVGLGFNKLYELFLERKNEKFSEKQREFQLWRRSRYVEFNLLWDRGTKFGIQSNGRTESILMTMPKTACWKYSYQSPPGTPEALLVDFYLKPQNWSKLKESDEQILINNNNNNSNNNKS